VAMSNIENFNNAAKAYGVPTTALFQTPDLYEGRKGPLLNVINCLNQLGFVVRILLFHFNESKAEFPSNATHATYATQLTQRPLLFQRFRRCLSRRRVRCVFAYFSCVHCVRCVLACVLSCVCCVRCVRCVGWMETTLYAGYYAAVEVVALLVQLVRPSVCPSTSPPDRLSVSYKLLVLKSA